jgi:chemotaxis methyl-accepting protein methylase
MDEAAVMPLCPLVELHTGIHLDADRQVVLLRNVLICFLQETKTRALNHVLRQLQCPGGVLALGATESLGGHGTFRPVQFGQLRCYSHA